MPAFKAVTLLPRRYSTDLSSAVSVTDALSVDEAVIRTVSHSFIVRLSPHEKVIDAFPVLEEEVGSPVEPLSEFVAPPPHAVSAKQNVRTIAMIEIKFLMLFFIFASIYF